MAYEREPFMPTRRQFLRYGAGSALGIGLAGSGIPLFRGSNDAVGASLSPAGSIIRNSVPADPTQRTLVVLQLGGGNDGLNTVIPFTDPAYATLRPTIGKKAADVLPISNTLAFNPNLSKLMDIWNSGKLAVLEGVEYPQPNYSHFRSTEIWMTGDDQNVGSLGWLGHSLDHLSNHPALVAASLGVTVPQALVGMQPVDIALGGSLASFGYRPLGKVDPGAVSAIYDYMDSTTTSATPYKKLVTQSHEIAQEAMAGVAKAASGYTPAVTYPNTSLAAGLQTVAQLIHGGVGARVLYLATGGFDTHANQVGTHDTLLKYLGDGLAAFWQDISAHGHADSVALMTFSEFGRRPGENFSKGTDHGSASVMFVMGGGVKGGVYGNAPTLTNLDNGNLRVQQDFRTVYAAMLQNWLGFTESDILPYGPYTPTNLFGQTPNPIPELRPTAVVSPSTAPALPGPVRRAEPTQTIRTTSGGPTPAPTATPDAIPARR